MARTSGGRRPLASLAKGDHGAEGAHPHGAGHSSGEPRKTGKAGWGSEATRVTRAALLARSIVLHLLPGAALFAFVLVAAALEMEPILALLVGIALVIIPLELGYLLYQGKRKTRRWSLSEIVDYREPLPARRIALWAIPLVAWFILMLFLSRRRTRREDRRRTLLLVSRVSPQVRVPRGKRHVRDLGHSRRVRARVHNQRRDRPGGRGTLLPWPSAAADRPLRPRAPILNAALFSH